MLLEDTNLKQKSKFSMLLLDMSRTIIGASIKIVNDCRPLQKSSLADV